MNPWKSNPRRGALDPTPYHVRKADVGARQLGGFLLIGTSFVTLIIPLTRPGRGTIISLLWIAATFSVGAALFFSGELLRRRQKVWAAQAILAVAGSLALGGVVAFVIGALGIRSATALYCPGAVAVMCALPLAWHAHRAVDELRRESDRQPTGFEPILPAAHLPRTPDLSQNTTRDEP